MKIKIDALKALELKLAEYSKANGAIAKHNSSNINCNCRGGCQGSCMGSCRGSTKRVS
ncbi:MAG: hypothetical protein IJG33_11895 [Selenomonadaceae bacterium]|nr:hypothetical protein [Selenomonadaceae bacterium]